MGKNLAPHCLNSLKHPSSSFPPWSTLTLWGDLGVTLSCWSVLVRTYTHVRALSPFFKTKISLYYTITMFACSLSHSRPTPQPSPLFFSLSVLPFWKKISSPLWVHFPEAALSRLSDHSPALPTEQAGLLGSLRKDLGDGSPTPPSPLSLGRELPTGSAWSLQSLLWPRAAYTWVGESAYSGCNIRQPTSRQIEPHSLIADLSLVKVMFGGSICPSLVLISQLVQNVGGEARVLFTGSY